MLVKDLVDEAVKRQTNRVYKAGTVSKASLLALEASDFAADEGSSASAAATALDALDNITGLKSVKVRARRPWKGRDRTRPKGASRRGRTPEV